MGRKPRSRARDVFGSRLLGETHTVTPLVFGVAIYKIAN